MLTRHFRPGTRGQVGASAVGLCVCVCVLLLAVLAPRAVAGSTGSGRTPDSGVSCVVDPTTGTCTVQASAPGSGGGTTGGTDGGTGGNGPAPTCSYQGQAVPCEDPPYGYWDGVSCYDTLADPQPPASSPLWVGHKPGDGGAIYLEYCPYQPGANGAVLYEAYLAVAPPNQPAVDPAVLAQEAVGLMNLRAPVIGTDPRHGGMGLVSMPVWMWTTVNKHTWGPNTVTVAVGGVTVTATGQVTKIAWQMGNGKTVDCSKPGVRYTAAAGLSQSPSCGYSGYTTDGTFTVTASSYWTVTWTSNVTAGDQFIYLDPMTSQTTLNIDQAQALN